LWPSWFSARESPAAQPDVQPAAQTGVLFHDAQLSGVLSLSSKRSLFPVGPLRRLHSELCRRLCSSPRNQPCSMLCSELRQAGKRPWLGSTAAARRVRWEMHGAKTLTSFSRAPGALMPSSFLVSFSHQKIL